MFSPKAQFKPEPHQFLAIPLIFTPHYSKTNPTLPFNPIIQSFTPPIQPKRHSYADNERLLDFQT